jgi:hypothetical protein
MMWAVFLFPSYFGGVVMTTVVDPNKLLHYELKAQLAALTQELTRERVCVLQAGGVPANEVELRYQKLFEVMQVRGLAALCLPPPRMSIKPLPQQQHPLMAGWHKTGPRLCGNH